MISWEREPFHIPPSLLLLLLRQSQSDTTIAQRGRRWQVGKDTYAEYRVGSEAEALLPVCPYVTPVEVELIPDQAPMTYGILSVLNRHVLKYRPISDNLLSRSLIIPPSLLRVLTLFVLLRRGGMEIGFGLHGSPHGRL